MRRAEIHDAGCDPGRAAGAVICGAMFGDKLSPLSDTTNLAPAVAGSRLGDHVRSMLYTTIPAFVVSLILFTLLGIQQTSGAYEMSDLSTYIAALEGEFSIGFLALIPAVVIIVLLLLLRVNAGVAAKARSKLVVTTHRIYHMNVLDNSKDLEAEMAWRCDAILKEIREAGYDGPVVNGHDLDVF